MDYNRDSEKNSTSRAPRNKLIQLAAITDSLLAFVCFGVAFYLVAIAGLCTESAYRRKTESYWCEGRSSPRIGGECSPCGLIYLTLYGNNSLSQVALVWVGILYAVFILLLPILGAISLIRYAYRNVTVKQASWYRRRWTILFYVFIVHVVILFIIRLFSRQYEGWPFFLAAVVVKIFIYVCLGVVKPGTDDERRLDQNYPPHHHLRTNSPVETTL